MARRGLFAALCLWTNSPAGCLIVASPPQVGVTVIATSAKPHPSTGILTLSLLLCCPALAVALTQAASEPAKPAQSTEQKPATAPMTAAEKRKADLQADTEKLFKLTQELKAEVDKSNKDTLSVSVVKKAQEVERLAKSIKERSRNP